VAKPLTSKHKAVMFQRTAQRTSRQRKALVFVTTVNCGATGHRANVTIHDLQTLLLYPAFDMAAVRSH
jgi:hypothetical protein